MLEIVLKVQCDKLAKFAVLTQHTYRQVLSSTKSSQWLDKRSTLGVSSDMVFRSGGKSTMELPGVALDGSEGVERLSVAWT